MHRNRALASAIVTLTLACAAEPVTPDQTPGTSGINITAFAAGTPISTLVVEVSAADIAPTLIFNLTVDDVTGVASGAVRVPHGSARLFSLTAFDETGAITHEGQASMDVRPGPNPPLQINLGPRSGQVPVTVTFGAFSVIVSPAEATLDGPGTTLQLVAQVTDADGQPVGDLSSLQWATSAPWVATVDAAGLATATAQGTASIVATYEGVAGMSAVTVNGSGGGAVDLDADGFTSDVDCNDEDSEIYPGKTETLDGVDNDCDGQIDENFQAVITEVMADAALASDVTGEWIEIHNAGPESMDLTGWHLGTVGPDRCQLPDAAAIPPGGYAVVGPSADPALNGGISNVILCSGVPLANGGFDLYIAVEGPAGLETLDLASFSLPATSGVSRSLDPSANSSAANDDPAQWCLASTPYGLGDLGTPGTPNPACP